MQYHPAPAAAACCPIPDRESLARVTSDVPAASDGGVLAQDELGEVEKIKYFVEPDTHFVRFVILYSTVHRFQFGGNLSRARE